MKKGKTMQKDSPAAQHGNGLAGESGDLLIGNDLRVARLGFGAMRITGNGIWGEPADRPEAIRVVQRAVELGINFIDTADSYGPGVSEEIIAEALHPYPAGLVIATKGGFNRPGPNQWVENGRPEHLKSACEEACAGYVWIGSMFINCIESTRGFRPKTNLARSRLCRIAIARSSRP
jgi:hypothetical protein